jgi:hypothetical protein
MIFGMLVDRMVGAARAASFFVNAFLAGQII